MCLIIHCDSEHKTICKEEKRRLKDKELADTATLSTLLNKTNINDSKSINETNLKEAKNSIETNTDLD